MSVFARVLELSRAARDGESRVLAEPFLLTCRQVIPVVGARLG